jgi:hypothetical protein
MPIKKIAFFLLLKLIFNNFTGPSKSRRHLYKLIYYLLDKQNLIFKSIQCHILGTNLREFYLTKYVIYFVFQWKHFFQYNGVFLIFNYIFVLLLALNL